MALKMFALLVVTCGVAHTTILVSVDMTKSVSLRPHPTFVQWGRILTINKTEKTDTMSYFYGIVNIPPNTTSMVLPATLEDKYIPYIDPNGVTWASNTFTSIGDPNINIYYGMGQYINWTYTGKLNSHGTPLFLYYFKWIDLAQIPLAQICVKDCYCKSPPCLPTVI